MNQKNNGGQAFPTSDQSVAHAIAAAAIEGIEDTAERDRIYIAARAQAQQGMTLRDYFAGQALAGLATAQDSDGTWRHGDPDDVACAAYQIANAMLRARKLP